MASAVLASRNQPYWGEDKVYFMRRYPTSTAASSSSDNHLLNLTNPNADPNPNPNGFNIIRQIHAQSTDAHPEDGESEELAGYGGYVNFNLASYTRKDMKELKRRFISELERVKALKKWIESIDLESRPGYSTQAAEAVKGKDKRHPKGKPSHPSSELGTSKKGGSGLKRGNPFGGGKDPKRPATEPLTEKLLTSMMKRCGQILNKLMKHKFGWVFNEPVNVEKLKLHDYYQIIKHPMDLGTVKSNLEKGIYESPLDFASDVRLTFNNAMTYNPKGQDVHVMAEQLINLFDEMFNPAYKKFEDERRKVSASDQPKQRVLQASQESARRAATFPDTVAIAKKSETIREQPSLPTPPQPAGNTVSKPVVTSKRLPKPKARDPNKRDMTFEEKARLGLNLQNLPQEKMVQLVNIIRKRNQHLAQDGDEIELDIEAVDNETLWELDRFVSNHKKMESKIRRQGLIQNQISATELDKSPVSETPEAAQKGKKGDAGDEDVDIGEDMPMSSFPPVEIEKDATGAATSSSSSSSSSSSDSSSSDSDSGSSSGSDSDADSVQSPFVEPKEGNGT